jgi:hypothetical protein
MPEEVGVVRSGATYNAIAMNGGNKPSALTGGCGLAGNLALAADRPKLDAHAHKPLDAGPPGSGARAVLRRRVKAKCSQALHLLRIGQSQLMPGPRWTRQLSITTISLRLSVGIKHCST